jgi:hypothetical protein
VAEGGDRFWFFALQRARTGARPIDQLALGHNGRLVVIELKVNEDREHVFQGVGYWRRVEAHRRRGHISTARLFGERELSDESPLVLPGGSGAALSPYVCDPRPDDRAGYRDLSVQY